MPAALLALLAACVKPAPAPATPPVAPSPPALELVESVPEGSPLDDPAIVDTPAVWPDLIRGATRTLDIEQFYIAVEGDPVMEGVLAEVEAAAARGVRVRVVADAKFADIYPEPLARLDAHPGVEVRRLDLKPLTGGVQHAKLFVVDGEVGFLGSQNWDWRALHHIQELGLVVRVPEVVRGLEDVFAADWARAGDEPLPPPPAPYAPSTVPYRGGQVTVDFVASPEGLLPEPGAWELPRILALLDGAATSVRVQLLSFAVTGYDGQDWTVLDEALRRAADRGVDVRLMVADWSKEARTVGTLQALAAHPGVQVRFVVVPPAAEGFIPFARVVHSKLLVVDGQRSWLGTSNWGRDYFHGSRNVGVVVDGAPFALDLVRRFDLTWDSGLTEPVDPEATYTPPRKK